MIAKHAFGLISHTPEARLESIGRNRRAVTLTLLAVALAVLLAGPVSAQSTQAETPVPGPSVPPGNSPRAEGPAQANPEPDLSEEDDDGGEGCPYLGQPLELVV